MNKNLTMTGLGFASGLPYMLIFSTLSIWLRDAGIDLTIIGFFAWISLTYSLKFLWSPLVDRYSIPFLNYFGSRKSWIILMQIFIVIFLGTGQVAALITEPPTRGYMREFVPEWMRILRSEGPTNG
mgnify:CR=1 FL=1